MYISEIGEIMVYLSTIEKRSVTQCNVNYSPEGILHPDRVMADYDLLFLENGSWNIIEDEITYSLQAGNVLILEPNLHHYSLEKCSPNMKNMYIHCSYLPTDGFFTQDCISLNKITDCTIRPQVSKLFNEIIETYWSRHSLHLSNRMD